MSIITPFEALENAVEKAGSQAELSRIAGVSTTAVWKWLQSSKRVPAEFVLDIERGTGVSRFDLRPDIYPRQIMVDHGTPARFAGVDQMGGMRPVHAADHTCAIANVDFNRDQKVKGAA